MKPPAQVQQLFTWFQSGVKPRRYSDEDSQEGTYAESEDALLDKNAPLHSTGRRRRSFPWIWVHCLILTFYMGLFLSFTVSTQNKERQCADDQSMVWSPAREALVPEKVYFWNEVGTDANVYKGPPSPALDAAWNELVLYSNLRIKAEDLRKINRTSVRLSDANGQLTDYYWSGLNVHHQIHCLKLMRQALYPDYYFKNNVKLQRHLQDHLDHCIDNIRMTLMCKADISLGSYDWVDNNRRPLTNFRSEHSCYNWDMVNNWARDRHFDIYDNVTLVHPFLGIVGLDVALVLAQRGYGRHTTVIAEHLPGDTSVTYTSPWAGCNFSAISGQDANALKWDKAGYAHLTKLASEHPKESFVHRTPSTEMWDNVIPRDKIKHMSDYLEDFKVLPKEELPGGVDFAVSFTTVTVNAPSHLLYLYRRLRNEYGVRFIRNKLAGIETAYANAETRIVFNCTGNAARTLPGVEDPKCYPTRGQVVLTRAPCVKTNIMRHGKDYETYVIPRPGSNGNVVLGGYMQKGNGDGATYGHETESIVHRTEELSTELRGSGHEVLAVFAGLRPSREGGARIERDEVLVAGQRRAIVHNYGAGGTGFQAGYGMAVDAVDAAADILKTLWPDFHSLESLQLFVWHANLITMFPSLILSAVAFTAAAAASAIPRADGEACTNPAVRKEWRELTSAEKSEYIRAAVCIRGLPKEKYAQIDAVTTRLDDLVHTHRTLDLQIHFVANFLPWHRWFVQLHEDLLRTECGFTGAQPYWDWSIDADAVNVPNSPIFDPTTGFGGNGQRTNSTQPGFERCLVDGPFANTNLTLGMGWPDEDSAGDRLHCLSRQFNNAIPDENGDYVPGDMQAGAYNSAVVNTILNFDTFSSMSNMLEGLPHAQGNVLFGDMGPITSPNEPLFFLHHGNVDRIWAKWQGRNATRLADYTGFNDRNDTIRAHTGDAMPAMELSDVAPIVKDYMDIEAGALCYSYST
ncbi:D-amino-acid oxidase [Paramyrothecium foliicola]|nr:D-amino-acid oxidase [Paramyrothecium foliicola]